MIPTAHPTQQPKRHPYRFSCLCTDDRRVSLYCTMGRPFSSKNLPIPTGDLDPHLIHGSPSPPKSSIQTAAQSVQPFLQGSLVWQTDRPTDHGTWSVRIGRIYIRSTAMRPNNNNNNLTYNVHSVRKSRIIGGAGSCQVERNGLCYWVAKWPRKWDWSDV